MYKQVVRTGVLTFLWMGTVSQWSAGSAAQAADGTILINQQKAQTGSVTTGDAPGFPVTLSQPGSYVLSGNLTVPDQNTTAIQVTADNVTIDLNGFSIIGPNIANGFGEGVSAGSRTNIAVLNGTVRGMGSSGVYLGNKARAEGLRLISNTDGIRIGVDSLVQNITALGNRITGVDLFGKSTLLNSVVTQNGEDGILAGDECLLQGNIVLGNGRYGISVEGSSTVLHNTVTGNGDFGLLLGSRTGYAQNVVAENKIISGPQVSGGLQMGTNVCGSDTICP
jgi:parallel beta-helix repeat protein